MSDEESRGKIEHMERAKQLLLFDGMLYDKKITPTDFDGCIEYKNVAWIVCEVKKGNTELKYGQRLALNRFVDDTFRAGKHVLAIIAEHNVENVNDPVYLKDCIVRETKRDFGDWQRCEKQITVKEMVDLFIAMMEQGIKGRTIINE